MTEIPEGQIPRDAAFWRTYNAVNKEHAQAIARLRCSEEGHDLVMSSEGSVCQRCRMPLDDALREMGFVEEGDRWVKR